MMRRYMRAAVLRTVGEPLSIEKLEFGSIAFGQVLVRMLFSGICRSQLMEQKGFRGQNKWLPHLLGHEGLGIVIEVGPGVKKCKPNDRVIISWIRGSGIEAEKPTYLDMRGMRVNSGLSTTFSDYSIVSENRVFGSPKGFDDRILPLFGCALLTGGGMALRYGSDSSVESIAVVGFGGVGSAAALVLRGMQQSNVTIFDPSPRKQDFARSLGFDQVYSNIDKAIEKFDLILESSGTIRGIENSFDALQDKGLLVFASHPPTGEKISIDPHELIKGKSIFGSWGGDVEPDEDLPRISELIRASKAPLDLLVGRLFPLEQVNQGLEYLNSNESGRPMISFAGAL